MWARELSSCSWIRSPGTTVPEDLKIQIGVQPESGRLPEVVYTTPPDDSGGQLQYKVLSSLIATSSGRSAWCSKVRKAAEKNFRGWKRLRWASENGTCCFYLLPFLAIAFLWFRGMSRREAGGRRLQAA